MSADPLYPASWLPLLTNGGGDYLYIDRCQGDHSPLLVLRSYDEVSDLPLYDSLLAFFRTLVEAHQRNLFGYEERTVRELQDDDQYKIVTWKAMCVRDTVAWEGAWRRHNPVTARIHHTFG